MHCIMTSFQLRSIQKQLKNLERDHHELLQEKTALEEDRRYGMILTHCSLGDQDVILKMQFSNLFTDCDLRPCENAPRWMPLDLMGDKPTLLQLMAWCCQATSHYLSQCWPSSVYWPSSVSPYGITRPQWVNHCHAEFIFGKKVFILLTLKWCRYLKSFPTGDKDRFILHSQYIIQRLNARLQ